MFKWFGNMIYEFGSMWADVLIFIIRFACSHYEYLFLMCVLYWIMRMMHSKFN